MLKANVDTAGSLALPISLKQKDAYNNKLEDLVTYGIGAYNSTIARKQ